MELSKTIKDKIESIRGEFPTTQSLLIPLLHAIQEEDGWISRDSIQSAASFLDLPLGRVEEVLTFYSMFKTKPIGKHHLQVCKNISCWLNGSDDVVSCIKDKLKINLNETTKDNLFTLEVVECLASCGTAPVVQVNTKYHENMTLEKMESLIDELSMESVKGVSE
jgi:NADH-quinone oxidoreductase E subunit